MTTRCALRSTSPASSGDPTAIARRALLLGGAAAAGFAAWRAVRGGRLPMASVFVARNQSYRHDLARTIRDGLQATGFEATWFRGKRVLLKPNLVEPTREAPHVTTHPAVIRAAAEVFRGWGATVQVGEAPGHVRDSEQALVDSGLRDELREARLPFADLNYEPFACVPNSGGTSRLSGICFPRSVLEADLVVSLPKMKTHHWVGVTSAMKNLYGTLPGLRYGWPKNVLHFAGIPQTVFDINASLPRTAAIVDAIDCMEGDGPIMGTVRPMGLLVVGRNLPAVDATVCRLMRIDPGKVSYLALAEDRLGPIDDRRIEQRGESWQPLAQTFQLLDKPHLRDLRAEPITG